MYDARNFVSELATAQAVLAEQKFEFKGKYVIHDIIYKSKNPELGIDKVFLRLRKVPENIWGEKPFIVAIKQTELKEIGKQSIIPIKKQFDTEEEARKFIEENYSNDFELDYEFDRVGWQYDMCDDQVDLEEIEGHYSVEFKSPTEEGLHRLLTVFKAENIITGPSVVAVKELLGR